MTQSVLFGLLWVDVGFKPTPALKNVVVFSCIGLCLPIVCNISMPTPFFPTFLPPLPHTPFLPLRFYHSVPTQAISTLGDLNEDIQGEDVFEEFG